MRIATLAVTGLLSACDGAPPDPPAEPPADSPSVSSEGSRDAPTGLQVVEVLRSGGALVVSGTAWRADGDRVHVRSGPPGGPATRTGETQVRGGTFEVRLDGTEGESPSGAVYEVVLGPHGAPQGDTVRLEPGSSEMERLILWTGSPELPGTPGRAAQELLDAWRDHAWDTAVVRTDPQWRRRASAPAHQLEAQLREIEILSVEWVRIRQAGPDVADVHARVRLGPTERTGAGSIHMIWRRSPDGTWTIHPWAGIRAEVTGDVPAGAGTDSGGGEPR